MAAYATVSQKIRSAVWERRAAGEKQHSLARAADVDPATFSSLVNNIIPVRAGDERVLRIAAVLSIDPADAFDRSRARETIGQI
jgi:hypothetical protein